MLYNSVLFTIRKTEIPTQYVHSPALLTEQCQSLLFSMISKSKEVAVKTKEKKTANPQKLI